MKTIVRKIIGIIIRRHDFDNEFSYLEIYYNGRLKDAFFAEKQFLLENGSLKNGVTKYFFCENERNPEKNINKIDPLTFADFDALFYIDYDGFIKNIKE
jgi:hypothetical protein